MAEVILSVPIDPEMLNRMMQANSPNLRGKWLMIPVYRLTFLVPAGQKVVIPFALPDGWVCTRRSPLRFESNYYDVNITIDVYCDDHKVNPYPMPLTHPFDVDFGVYYVKFSEVKIVFMNNSDKDAEITFQVTPHLIKEYEMYYGWYKPIIEHAYDILTRMARRRG